MAEDAHRRRHRLAQHRLAGARNHAAQHRAQFLLRRIVVQQPAG